MLLPGSDYFASISHQHRAHPTPISLYFRAEPRALPGPPNEGGLVERDIFAK